jgi:hypothetical protein
MSLAVPQVLNQITTASRNLYPPPETPQTKPDPVEEFAVKYDSSRHEVIFESTQEACPVRKGDWIVLTSTGKKDTIISNSELTSPSSISLQD